MGLENVKSGKLLYHLTELKNLESIIRFGLVPRKVLQENTVIFEDIANPEIIVKRERLGLDEYIPFHFHPYTAFDLAVKKQHANDEMMYICISRELARRNNFKILPKHPLSLENCQLYDYEEGFKRIDWDTMAKVGLSDQVSKQTKMAECLSAKVIPVDCFFVLLCSFRTIKGICRKYFAHIWGRVSTAICQCNAPVVLTGR